MTMLEPYRVLDFTDERGEIGPMVLGDLGADVIRVEPPGGTAARRVEPRIDGDHGDLASLSFRAFNRNKRSIVLDPRRLAADRGVLESLIATADFVFESGPPRTVGEFGLDADAVREINPRIVHVCVSPFGIDGPRAEDLGNDLVVAAMGGPVFLQGPEDRAPVRVSVPQVWRHVGVESAVGALAAHARMLKTGTGGFVDVSAQCAMTWTMLQAMDAHAIQGFDFERGGSLMLGIEIVQPCKDGHLIALPSSDVIVGLLDWMIEEGAIDASAREVDWELYDQSFRDPELTQRWTLAEMTEILRAFFARHTKRELFDFGIAHGITLAPVGTVPEMLDLEHLTAREYWHELAVPGTGVVRTAGAWAKSNESSPAPVSVRRDAPGARCGRARHPRGTRCGVGTCRPNGAAGRGRGTLRRRCAPVRGPEGRGFRVGGRGPDHVEVPGRPRRHGRPRGVGEPARRAARRARRSRTTYLASTGRSSSATSTRRSWDWPSTCRRTRRSPSRSG